MRTAKGLAHLPGWLVCELCWLKILVRRLVELVRQRLDRLGRSLLRACLILGLKFIRLPGVRPGGRIVKRVIHYRLLKIKFRTAKTAKICFRRIEFSTVLTRIHHLPASRLRSITNNSKEMFVYRF